MMEIYLFKEVMKENSNIRLEETFEEAKIHDVTVCEKNCDHEKNKHEKHDHEEKKDCEYRNG